MIKRAAVRCRAGIESEISNRATSRQAKSDVGMTNLPPLAWTGCLVQYPNKIGNLKSSFSAPFFVSMPKTFAELGLNLMYPDNWETLPRSETEPPGVSFDLPGGGFLSLDQIDGENDEIVDLWLEKSAKTIRDDYGEVESEELRTSDIVGFFRGTEFRFYYLDMIIISA